MGARGAIAPQSPVRPIPAEPFVPADPGDTEDTWGTQRTPRGHAGTRAGRGSSRAGGTPGWRPRCPLGAGAEAVPGRTGGQGRLGTYRGRQRGRSGAGAGSGAGRAGRGGGTGEGPGRCGSGESAGGERGTALLSPAPPRPGFTPARLYPGPALPRFSRGRRSRPHGPGPARPRAPPAPAPQRHPCPLPVSRTLVNSRFFHPAGFSCCKKAPGGCS